MMLNALDLYHAEDQLENYRWSLEGMDRLFLFLTRRYKLKNRVTHYHLSKERLQKSVLCSNHGDT